MTDLDPIGALIETAEGPVPPDPAFAIAAAAVLLITLISGMASLAPVNRSTGPATIHAPVTDQPLMPGGTAAQGNRYPGPAPIAPEYELRQRLGTVLDSFTGQVLAYG